MKLATFSFLTLVLSFGFASANTQQGCFEEAQIIAEVASSHAVDNELCVVLVKNISFYNENQICGLDVAEVLHKGIFVQVKKHTSDCSSLKSISGIIVKDSSDNIFLE